MAEKLFWEITQKLTNSLGSYEKSCCNSKIPTEILQKEITIDFYRQIISDHLKLLTEILSKN